MLQTKENLHTYTDISLPRFRVWTIEGDRRGDVIRCVDGKLWITQEDDLKDHVVLAGKDFWVTKAGTVVVQALEASRFKYSLAEEQNREEVNRQSFHRTHHAGLPRPLR